VYFEGPTFLSNPSAENPPPNIEVSFDDEQLSSLDDDSQTTWSTLFEYLISRLVGPGLGASTRTGSSSSIAPVIMASLASALKSLPKPKYTGHDESLPTHTTRLTGPRVVDAASLDTQVTLSRRGPPLYGSRVGWTPRSEEDFGGGGAFPEVPRAQYPLGMGKKNTGSSNAMQAEVDQNGLIKYDSIARRGHGASRIVQASFSDLIPLRQRADVGEISLERPDKEEVQASKERTEAALAALVNGAVAAQKPKTLAKPISNKDATFVRYTPSAQFGDTSEKKDRIIKIVGRQQDPMEPPKFKHKKIPRGPPSPPPPVLHSPPRKLTAADQEMWKIPPALSNWKNSNGYTVPLDKRLAADGRGLQDVTINDKFSQFAEALYTADRHARDEVKQRSMMQQKLAEKEKATREENLRQLAQKARDERAAAGSSSRRSRSRSAGSYDSYDSEEEAAKEREHDRRDRDRERQRELRMSKMGAEKRVKALAREQGRDISEKVALGLAKPTASAESMYDSRLFNRSSGFAAGFNEDQAYDRPLFAAQDALSSIYRPKLGEDDGEGAEETLDRLKGSKRFEGFKDAAHAEEREGPVQFEKDRVIAGTVPGKGEDDPFNIGQMISDVTASKGGTKRYGMQDDDDDGRGSKRAKVDDDDDDDDDDD
jgi:SNW domain-containing protein 1